MEPCYLCRYFQRYYIKGTKLFTRTKIGWCGEKHENVSSTCGCKEFKFRPNLKYPPDLALLQLSDILTQITEIRKYLEEKLGDAKEEM